MALLTHFPFFACSAELLLNLHQPSFCSSFLATSTLKLGGWAEFSSFSWAQGEHAGNLPHFCLLALCNHLETPILCASTTMCMLDSNVLSADVLNANTSFSLPSILSMPTPSFYFLHIVCLYSLILCQPLMACNVLQLYTSTLVSCVLWGFQLGILSFGAFSTRSLVAQVLLPVFWCSGSCLCMWNLISCFLLQAWCLKGWGVLLWNFLSFSWARMALLILVLGFITPLFVCVLPVYSYQACTQAQVTASIMSTPEQQGMYQLHWYRS